MAYLIALHALAAVIWVGGMFFLIVLLAPAAVRIALTDRLALLSQVLGRFFAWVWAVVIVLVLTGYAMIGLLGGMGAVPAYVHVMQALGWAMFLLFGHIFFVPWRRLRAALAAGALADAGRAMNQLRLLAGGNLALGLIVVAVAAGGRYGLV